MMLLIRGRAARRSIKSSFNEEMSMKWETPLAIDYRFGMEITMYVSNR
jgi:coenzyme PQQ precursor peptide PqqA